MKFRILLSVLAAALCMAMPALADPITYTVTGSVPGGASYWYTLTTDGTMGALTDANITDYSFHVEDAYGSRTHKKGDDYAYFWLASGLSASASGLWIDYNNKNLAFGFAYDLYADSDDYDVISYCAPGYCNVAAQLMVGVGYEGDNIRLYQSNALNGKVQIATAPASVSPVPEPSTWAMVGSGLGLGGVALYRRRQQQGDLFYAAPAAV